MAVETKNYGTFNTHAGTLAEVAAAVNGKASSKLVWFYDGTTGVEKVTCIEYIQVSEWHIVQYRM